MPSAAPECPVKGMIETSFVDWKGCLSTVLFTGGCNFRCPYCHNADLVENWGRLDDVPLDYVLAHFRKFKDWLDRVVVTGGEPTIHRGLGRLIGRLKEAGLLVKLDTNGSNPAVLRALLRDGLLDFVAMDLKGPLEYYDRWCGVPDVDANAVRESVAIIMEAEADHEFRMTVVPFLHKEKDVYAVAEYLKGAKRFTIQEFRPNNTLNPAFAYIRPYPTQTMERMRAKAADIFAGDTPDHA